MKAINYRHSRLRRSSRVSNYKEKKSCNVAQRRRSLGFLWRAENRRREREIKSLSFFLVHFEKCGFAVSTSGGNNNQEKLVCSALCRRFPYAQFLGDGSSFCGGALMIIILLPPLACIKSPSKLLLCSEEKLIICGFISGERCSSSSFFLQGVNRGGGGAFKPSCHTKGGRRQIGFSL